MGDISEGKVLLAQIWHDPENNKYVMTTEPEVTDARGMGRILCDLALGYVVANAPHDHEGHEHGHA